MTSSGGVNGMIDPYEGSDMVVEYRAEMCCDPTMHYWPLQRWGMTGTEQTTTDGPGGVGLTPRSPYQRQWRRSSSRCECVFRGEWGRRPG